MFDYDAERLRAVILEITRSNISSEAWAWLEEKLDLTEISAINTVFSLMPRKTGKEIINITPSEEMIIEEIKPGWSLNGWATDRLCRVCFLMHLDSDEKNRYFKTIEDLFLAAEMTELVALYSSLPVLALPEIWKMRCAEGIRSNIGTVLEAIMYENPYAAAHLDEKAWNQLVMKAFFTDKNVNRIYGYDARANAELALILSDYAHERWAAGRSVNPLLWRSTAKFIDSRLKKDLEKALSEGNLKEQQAAALTIFHSNSAEAKELLKNFSELVSAIEKNELTWNQV
ncbi:EboA domain-containing protein [Daejeonella sp.]|uniref:EboA domain-containing protein n=1 Tax=Daejeonella sp. TaxID=2805397 RepID=UPI0039832077